MSGKKLYVVNQESADISVVNIDTYQIQKTIPVGKHPTQILSLGKKLFITNKESNSISVIDMVKDELVQSISFPKPLAMTLVGEMLYVMSEEGTVGSFDTSTYTLRDTVQVGERPVSMTLTQGKLFVTHAKSPFVSVITIPAPELLGFVASSSSQDEPKEGQKITLHALFDQSLAAGSSITITLNNKKEITLSTLKSSQLTGEYIWQKSDDIRTLQVQSIKTVSIKSLW